MAVNAVSSSTGAAAQAVKQAQSQKSEASKVAAEETKARQVQKQQAQQQTGQSKPVVNAEGQTTGRVIHATA